MPQQPVNFYMGFRKGMIVLWDMIFSSHQIRLFEIASLDVKFPSWVDLHLWDSVQPASRVEMEHNKSAPSPFLSTQLHNSFFAWYPWPLFFLQLISLHPGWLPSCAIPPPWSRSRLLAHSIASMLLSRAGCHQGPWIQAVPNHMASSYSTYRVAYLLSLLENIRSV